MQRMLSLFRSCVDDYRMIDACDRIAVGVSGGKDSVTLLVLLAEMKKFYLLPFTVEAFTVDMGLAGMDFSPVAELCDRLEVPYHMIKTEIGPILFDYRKEKNPCSLCAKMRRGALGKAITEAGIHKIALGHHRDDAIETLLMSLVYEGAVPKDGPSAGVAMTCAIISCLSKRPVSPDVAMTGEVTLRGQALPIGGLREKSLAALRCGIKAIMVPKENKKDVEELPQEVKDSLRIEFMTSVEDAVKFCMVK